MQADRYVYPLGKLPSVQTERPEYGRWFVCLLIQISLLLSDCCCCWLFICFFVNAVSVQKSVHVTLITKTASQKWCVFSSQYFTDNQLEGVVRGEEKRFAGSVMLADYCPYLQVGHTCCLTSGWVVRYKCRVYGVLLYLSVGCTASPLGGLWDA